MTKLNSTEIVIIIDRSGSMTAIKRDMEGGFNTFIEEQKKVPGECRVSLVQFDDTDEVVYSGKPIAEVPPLNLQPRGMTALYDAIGKAVSGTGSRLAAMKEEDRPSQVLFLIVTDGHENSSHEFTSQRINEMITHQREKYSWEFVFLGANQDAITTAVGLGVSVTNAVTYDANSIGASSAMRGFSAGVTAYRSVGVGAMNGLFGQDAYNKVVEATINVPGGLGQSPVIITGTTGPVEPPIKTS